MRPVYRGPVPARVTALERQRGSATQTYDYHAIGAKLIGRIGEYCSYCETPLSGNAAIEHIVSKSTSPQLETNWENFLLACVNCNSTKGATRVQSADDLASYIWPCTPRDVQAGGRTFFSPADAFVYGLDAAQNAVVVAAPGPKQARAQATLEMVGLDKAPAEDAAVKDRRIANRTAVWNLAAATAAGFAPYLRDDGTASTPGAALIAAQIIDLAKAAGFWSVWMTLFSQMLAQKPNMAPATRADVLTRLFCASFPGTAYIVPNTVPADYTGLPAID
jgi:hypothetical protein